MPALECKLPMDKDHISVILMCEHLEEIAEVGQITTSWNLSL